MSTKTTKVIAEKPTTECVAPIYPPTLDKYPVSLRAYAKILSQDVFDTICPLNKLVSHEGNLKIPSNIAIFNFSSATDCPSDKLGLCAAKKAGVKCYAKKSERGYRKFVLPYRRRQGKFWKSITAEEFVGQFLMVNSRKLNPFIAIRFSESGDFNNQEELNKAEKIAQLLARFRIKVYCYSSRKDLDFSKCKNLIVSGSGFTKKGISNIFQIIKEEKDKPSGYGMCPGNCRICNRCQIRGMKTAILKH